jgi:ribose 5-phosphate isomerase A
MKNEEKRRAGYAAADRVEDGMVLGLGTGSTVYFTLERLANRVQNGLRLKGIPTSLHTEMLARSLGIPLISLEEVQHLDLAIDGADQVDRKGYLVKGRGGAHVREKIIADAADRLIIIVTPDKICNNLTAPVPVEVIRFGWPHVSRAIARLGGTARIRESVSGKDGPVITDNGNLILDGEFGEIRDPPWLEKALDQIPGVIGTGLFTGFTEKTEVIVGEKEGIHSILYR